MMLPEDGDKKQRHLPKKPPPGVSTPPPLPKVGGEEKRLLPKKLPQDVSKPPPLDNSVVPPVTPPPAPDATQPAEAGLIDALEKWGTDIEGARQYELQLIRLDSSDRLLIPFTTGVASAAIHWVEGANRGYYRCNGADCVLCRIGNNRQQMDLLPLYDVVSQTVGVLAISPAARPGSLMPKIREMLAFAKGNPGKSLLVAIRTPTKGTYAVTWSDLPAGAEDGRRTISEFGDRLKAGAMQLETAYQKLPNEEWASVPEVALAMKARGIAI